MDNPHLIIASLTEVVKRYEAAARNFIAKVERGEARSVRSLLEFQEAVSAHTKHREDVERGAFRGDDY